MTSGMSRKELWLAGFCLFTGGMFEQTDFLLCLTSDLLCMLYALYLSCSVIPSLNLPGLQVMVVKCYMDAAVHTGLVLM